VATAPDAAAPAVTGAGADASLRRVRIAVFCGSSSHARPVYFAAAHALGDEIARRGHTLIYGGGRTGLMGAVADGALEAGGDVQGVILDTFIRENVHHPLIQELHSVGDMRSRKAGLDERADGFAALPGGLGTLEELTEILSFRKLGLHHRRLVFVNTEGFFDPLLAQIERAIEQGFDHTRVRDSFAVTDDPRAVVGLLEPEGS
jgi:uncharacterized protein (TIGR00730 family)